MFEAGTPDLPLGCTTLASAEFNRTVESPGFSFPIKFPTIANGRKIQWKTVAAAFAGVGIGTLAMHGLQGGQANAPPAFGPRMDANNNRECTRMNTKTDKPQINQPSSG